MHLADAGERRIAAAEREVLGGGLRGERLRCAQEHLVGDLSALGDERAETHAREDVHVVALRTCTWRQ